MPKKNRAIFLDRDGTINVDKHYMYRIEDFEFIPGALVGLKLLHDAGYQLILITNQSGIGRGYFSEDQYLELQQWLEEELAKNGSPLAASYYCPHLPDAKIEKYRVECECRKPKLGMYGRAIRDHDIDVSQSFAIGDRLRDCSICKKYKGCKGYLVGNTEKQNVIDSVVNGDVDNVFYARDLLTAARMIVENK